MMMESLPDKYWNRVCFFIPKFSFSSDMLCRKTLQITCHAGTRRRIILFPMATKFLILQTAQGNFIEDKQSNPSHANSKKQDCCKAKS
jgi:hypothetical protein